MLARKTCVLRFSLCFNALVVVLFLGPHFAPRTDLEPAPPPPPPPPPLTVTHLLRNPASGDAEASPSVAPARPATAQQPSRPPPAPALRVDPPAVALDLTLSKDSPPSAGAAAAEAVTATGKNGAGGGGSGGGSVGVVGAAGGGAAAAGDAGAAAAEGGNAEAVTALPASTSHASVTQAAAANAGQKDDAAAEAEEDDEYSRRTLSEAIPCHDRDMDPRTAQRSDFWVLYNYIRADRRFHCWEAITYTTHADYTFLDNLEPLLERWRGPVSLAMHAPGTDFKPTLEAIRWARSCMTPLVAEMVTFHIFFGSHHVPPELPQSAKALLIGAAPNCSAPPPWTNVTSTQLYKTRSHILYPVNVGRNVARESAVTHFVLPSDIELYPSPGIIPAFLEMIRRNDPPLRRPALKVFPLSIFELEKGAPLPENKTHLISMLKNGTAIPFHKKLCSGCHNVPHSSEWLAANVTEGLHVFHIGKRLGYHIHWEPIFIGTNKDPLYDERLSWEGKSDKMTQGYALCVLDYEFHILDNAFLVHKPGIKTLKKDPQRAVLSRKTNNLIKKVIFPELKVLYGVRRGCAV